MWSSSHALRGIQSRVQSGDAEMQIPGGAEQQCQRLDRLKICSIESGLEQWMLLQACSVLLSESTLSNETEIILQ